MIFIGKFFAPLGPGKAFEEGAVALEAQSLVDMGGDFVVLVDVQDDVLNHFKLPIEEAVVASVRERAPDEFKAICEAFGN